MRTVSVMILVALAFAPATRASSRVIGQLIVPSAPTNDFISGLAFDGLNDPLVVDGYGTYVQRVRTTDASVISTQAVNFTRGVRSLEYDPSGGNYFTSVQQAGDSLASIHLAPASLTTIGSFSNQNFNFLSLATDPLGALWMLTDYDVPLGQTSLFTVNRATGAATLVTHLSIARVSTLGIDADGDFFVFTYGDTYQTEGKIFQVYPSSGTSNVIGGTSLFGPDFFTDVAFGPGGKLYGVEERRTASPRSYYLREIAIPEPASCGLIAAAGIAMVLRRSRRPAISAQA